ncbi:hypothetical protein WG936_09040 [Corynebacterium sp. H127]|uniref:hypothetical protein n=1 Tax=Corynebacterium sp. H127 TaxID=3133418 RepID=UPI0030AF1AE6
MGFSKKTVDGVKQYMIVCHSHDGRLSGLSINRPITAVNERSLLGDEAMQLCTNYIENPDVLPLHRAARIRLIQQCWFEPIEVVDNKGHRLAVFYLESHNDKPCRVFQVHVSKGERPRPTYYNQPAINAMGVIPGIRPDGSFDTEATIPAVDSREGDKRSRKFLAKSGANLLAIENMQHSPVFIDRRNSNGDVVYGFPRFQVSEPKLRAVLWKFKRAGHDRVELKLLRMSLGRQ